MRIVVLGASGQIGRELSKDLRRRGVDVVEASRASGVDAYTGEGLATALDGADVVVDCLNITTQSAPKAVDFFGTVATNVAQQALSSSVGHVVCLSIINAADPAVNAKFGYYRGKAEQEKVYRDTLDPDRLAIVRSSQWYELAHQLMSSLRLGPVAAVPHMRTRPASAHDVAVVLADAATSPGHDVEVAGPAEIDLVDVAKAIANETGAPRWIVGIRFGGTAIRDGGLLPKGEFVQTSTTLDEWIRASAGAPG